MPKKGWGRMRAGAAMALLGAAAAQAGPVAAEPFEVVHPEIRAGAFELEVLNAVTLSDVSRGDERSVHEFALGYAPASWWMPKLALEVANPESESAEIEAFAVESLFLLPLGRAAGHDHAHDHDHGAGAGFALGVYAKLEVPNAGGIGKGEVTFGPVAETALGPVGLIGNLFMDVPLEDGVEPGLSYALSAAVPVGAGFSLGAEAHGGMEEAFGEGSSLDRQEHFVGPALYSAFDLGRGRMLEPRAALLFGWTDAAPDAVLSLNVELKF